MVHPVTPLEETDHPFRVKE